LTGAATSEEPSTAWGFSVSPYVAVPVGPTAPNLSPGGGLRLTGAGYLPGLPLGLGALADYAYVPLTGAASAVTALGSGLELSSQFSFADGFSAGLRAGGGGYYAWLNSTPSVWVLNGWYGGGGELTWALGGGWALAMEAGYRQRMSFTDEVTLSLSIRNQPSTLTLSAPPLPLPAGFVPYSRDRQGLRLSALKAPVLYPVLAKSYESKPAVQLLFHNFESTAAEQLKLTVDWGLLGDGPKAVRMPDRLGPGLEVQIDLPTSWNSKLWTGPEASTVAGLLHLSFVQNSRPVAADLPITVKLQPRNAAPPDPAAWPVFVSTKDASTAALAKAALTARAAQKSALPAELQTLLAVQTGWKLLAVATLPPSPSIQFPRVTLKTRQGTVRDQALAWAGLAEASGLQAALAVSGDRTFAAWSPDNPAQTVPWFPGAPTVKAGSRTWIVVDPAAAPAGPVEAAQSAAQALAGQPAPQIIPLRDAWKALPPVDLPVVPAEPTPAPAAWAAALKAGSDQWMAQSGTAVIAGLQAQAEAAPKTDQPTLYNRLGVALARLSRWAEAADVLKRQASQGNRAALVNLGHVFLLSGQPKAALDPYQAALKLSAADTAVLTGMALAYRALGDAAMRKAVQSRLTQVDKALGAQVAALKPVAAAEAFQPAEVALWQGWIVWRE